MNDTSIDNVLIDLQSRLAYQEDMLQSLNKVCFEQDQKLQLLEQQNTELLEHLRGLLARDGAEASDDQPPPHY